MAAWAFGAALLLTSCGEHGPAPTLRAVEPARGFTDRPLRLVLRGTGFLPSYHLDPGAGRGRADASGFSGQVGGASLTDFGWRGPNELSATLQPGLGDGQHAVEIVDPRGARARVDAGFVSLGADRTPPILLFSSPDENTPVAAGARLTARLVAIDEGGGLLNLTWQARGRGLVLASGECPVDPQAELARCSFAVQVPLDWRPGDALELRAVAVDDAPAGNQGEIVRRLTLLPRPTVSAIIPALGGTAGGTEVVIKGSGFVQGTRVLFDDLPLFPAGGRRLDENTITGSTPAHAVGAVSVTLDTPLGEVTLPRLFEYRSPPQPRAIEPAVAPAEGNVVVVVRGDDFTPDTRIYLGTTLVGAVPLPAQMPGGPGEIRGLLPPGKGRVTVWAHDPAVGYGALPGGLSWSAPVSSPSGASP